MAVKDIIDEMRGDEWTWGDAEPYIRKWADALEKAMREPVIFMTEDPDAFPLKTIPLFALPPDAAGEVPGTATQVEDLHGQIHTLLERGDALRNDKKELQTEIKQLNRRYLREIENSQLLSKAVEELQAEIEKLREEVRVLRLYGNKDCTAMADAALAGKEDT
jgi:outer membrane murein-binding lipoprotein Lpp